MPQPTKLSRGTPHRKSWLAATMLAALVSAPPIAIAGEGGTSHIMPGANATLVDLPPIDAWRLLQADVRQLPRQRLGNRPYGGRDRRQPQRGCQHAGARWRLQRRADDPRRRAFQRGGVPALHVALHLRKLGRAGRTPDPEQRLRHRRRHIGAGDAGVEVRRLAVRLPDAGLCADGQLRDRTARQHGPQLLDRRSDRWRGLQQRQVGPQCGHPPGLRDQHGEQRHRLQERRHPARRRGGAADLSRSVPDSPTSVPKRGTSSRSRATAGPARRWAASRDARRASGRCWATSSRSASPGCSSS